MKKTPIHDKLKSDWTRVIRSTEKITRIKISRELMSAVEERYQHNDHGDYCLRCDLANLIEETVGADKK